jgi:hypothetical protein
MARIGDIRYAYKILAGKILGKRTLERRPRRWDDNNNTDLKEMGCEDRGVDGTGSGSCPTTGFRSEVLKFRVLLPVLVRYMFPSN